MPTGCDLSDLMSSVLALILESLPPFVSPFFFPSSILGFLAHRLGLELLFLVCLLSLSLSLSLESQRSTSPTRASIVRVNLAGNSPTTLGDQVQATTSIIPPIASLSSLACVGFHRTVLLHVQAPSSPLALFEPPSR